MKKTKRNIEQITEDVLSYKEIIAESSIEVGELLLEAKAVLKHGEWLKWLAEKVDYGQRTAEEYMLLGKVYGGKSRTFANLGKSKLLTLTRLSDDERETFMQQNDVKNMSCRNIEKKVEEFKQNSGILKVEDAEPSTLDEVQNNNVDENNLVELKGSKGQSTNQIKEYIARLESEIKSLKEENQKLKSAPATVREVDKTDYELVNRLRDEVDKLTKKLDEAIRMKNLYMESAEIRKKDAEEYKQLKNEIDFLVKERSNIGRQIESATELASLTVKLQHMLEEDLAPIKYKRCMEELDRGTVAMENLMTVVVLVESWTNEMRQYLPATIVDSEVIEVEEQQIIDFPVAM